MGSRPAARGAHHGRLLLKPSAIAPEELVPLPEHGMCMTIIPRQTLRCQLPAVPPFRSLRSGAGAIRTQAAHLSLGWTSWPFRSFAEWSGALEFKYLRDSGLRRVVKALVDFWCGALSVVAAVAVAEGFAGLRVGETARLAAVVGGFLVWTEVLTGRYRTMWRYMDLREAAVIATRSLVVLAGLLIARWAAQAPVSGATVLLTVLLTLS